MNDSGYLSSIKSNRYKYVPCVWNIVIILTVMKQIICNTG